jgi:alanine dehydrogenase
MIVGVPKEIKVHESRVAITPEGVSEFVHAGHTVIIENNAGVVHPLAMKNLLQPEPQLLLPPMMSGRNPT